MLIGVVLLLVPMIYFQHYISQGGDVDLLTLFVPRTPQIDYLGNGEEWIHALKNDTITPFAYSDQL